MKIQLLHDHEKECQIIPVGTDVTDSVNMPDTCFNNVTHAFDEHIIIP